MNEKPPPPYDPNPAGFGPPLAGFGPPITEPQAGIHKPKSKRSNLALGPDQAILRNSGPDRTGIIDGPWIPGQR